MARRTSRGHARRTRGATARRAPVALLLALALGFAGYVVISDTEPVQALNGSEFDPGLIISDDLFYDSNAMSTAQIQAFLDSKIGTCLTDRCLNVAVVPVESRSARYSTSTGELICGAIQGGNIPVAELIYRLQVACEISARVTLVTLQKEQGLVTSRAPGDWALRAAMGMGCPDSAACSEAFAGLSAQLVSGVQQLKTYKAARFGRQPGPQYVQYNPNPSCGGTTVNVRNYATAALYNYTPYQPNAAALANLGGLGDGCSSYGNRNFWVFYSQWFGAPTVPQCTTFHTEDIARHWEDLGGASGPLGASVAPGIVPGVGGVAVGHFENGQIYCTPRVGPYEVLGDIAAKFTAMGGPTGVLGSPVNSRVAFTANDVSGHYQDFQHAMMLSSAETGTFAVLHGAMRNAWGSLGGSGGSLGWPTGDQEAIPGGVRQQFQYGTLMLVAGQPPTVLVGEIGHYWSSGNNAAKLGASIGAPISITAGGITGSYQNFVNGMVLTSEETGTYSVLHGPIRNLWGSLDGTAGVMGWPVADQVSTPTGAQQEFQHGTIFASPSGVAGAVSGAVGDYWITGNNVARLGYPTGPSQEWTAGGVTGVLQYFQRGMVLSSTTTGTYSVLDGPMRDAWGRHGGSGGPYGWPTGDQYTVGNEVRQQFQHGLLTPTSGSPGNNSIATYLATGSNAARLGPAAGSPITITAQGITGLYQVFSRGMVLSASTTGTFSVMDGPIRNTWGALGGTGGSLGWPTADQVATAGGVKQQFQHGEIFAPAGGSGVVISGDIGAYWMSGSNASILGASTSAPIELDAHGISGHYQTFQRGLVVSSTTTGTFAVRDGAMRNAWGSLGGTGGALGWPLSEQTTIVGGVWQQFQNGVIVVPHGQPGVVLNGATVAYWLDGTNAAALGAPSGPAIAITAGGHEGTHQTFARAMLLHSDTIGTFAVLHGSIRNEWGRLGGTGGTLGWPVADQETVPEGVRQQFEHGAVVVPTSGTPYVVMN